MNCLRTALALTLAGLLVVLGACSGQEPKPKVAPSESTSPTESPSESRATLPEPARVTQAVLVRRFFGQISTAITSGESGAFLANSTTSCRNCRVIAKNLASAYADGGRIEKGHWTVLALRRAGSASNGAVWDVDIKTAKERWLDAHGRLIKVVTPDRLKFRVVVIGARNDWKIRELRIV